MTKFTGNTILSKLMLQDGFWVPICTVFPQKFPQSCGPGLLSDLQSKGVMGDQISSQMALLVLLSAFYKIPFLISTTAKIFLIHFFMAEKGLRGGRFDYLVA